MLVYRRVNKKKCGFSVFFSKGSETFEAAKLSFTESKWNILGASESGVKTGIRYTPKMEALPGNMMIHQRNLKFSPSFSYTPVIGSHIHELAYNLIYISIEYQTSNSYSVIYLHIVSPSSRILPSTGLANFWRSTCPAVPNLLPTRLRSQGDSECGPFLPVDFHGSFVLGNAFSLSCLGSATCRNWTNVTKMSCWHRMPLDSQNAHLNFKL